MHLFFIVGLEVVLFFALWRIYLNCYVRKEYIELIQSHYHPLNSDYTGPPTSKQAADTDDLFWWGLNVRYCELRMILYGLIVLVACAVIVWIIW